MRVVLDATVFQLRLTGVARTTLGLYRACRDLKPELHVLAFHQQPLAVDLPAGFESVTKASYLPRKLWRSLIVPTYISRQQPDVVHFPWNGDIPRLTSSHVVVTTLHDVLPLTIPGYFTSVLSEWAYRRQKQRDINRTHLLITVSEYSKQQILRNFSVRTEPVVVYPGQTLMMNPPINEPGQPKSSEYFLYVGGYDPRKGLVSLSKAFIGLHREKRISAKLILTGERKYFSQEFKDIIAEGLASKRIEELGYVPDQLLANLYRNAKALVYPSKYEGFGLPPLEAMALGCPVITTRHTSIPEVCGEAALYVETENEQRFSEALLAVDSDPALRAWLREKGLEQAAKFTWETAAQNFLSALQTIIEKKRAGRRGTVTWRR